MCAAPTENKLTKQPLVFARAFAFVPGLVLRWWPLMGNSSKKPKARGASANGLDISAIGAVKRSVTTPELNSHEIKRGGSEGLVQSSASPTTAVSQKRAGSKPKGPRTLMRSNDAASDEDKEIFHTSIKDNDSLFETDDSFDDSEILALETSNSKQKQLTKTSP
jgi:hypothetical protein